MQGKGNCRLGYSIVFLLLVSLPAWAQKADSLEQALTMCKTDSCTVITMSLLADALAQSNSNRAIELAKSGITISREIGFGRGVFKSSFSLARIFQGKAQFDSSIVYLHIALEQAVVDNKVADQAEICSFLGHSFMRKSVSDSARYFLDKGLILAKQAGDIRVEAGIQNNYGNLWLEESNHQLALECFIAAAKLYEPLNDNYGQCVALSNIGNVQYLLGKYDLAIDYAQQSLAIANANKLTSSIGYAYKLMGRIFRKEKKYDSALMQYKQAIDLYNGVGDQRSTSELMQNIGNIYFDQEKYSEALESYKNSLQIAKRISVRTLVAYAYSAIGQGYSAQRNFNMALVYLDSAQREAKVIGNIYLLISNYGARSELYESMGEYRKALDVHKMFVQLKDSIGEVENRELTEEAQARFELEKKETQIKLLQNDQRLKALALDRQRTFQMGVAIAFVLSLVIAVMAVGWLRAKNKAKRALEIEQLRNTIARDLHDDIGSTLSTINIASSLAIKGNNQDHSLYLNQIAGQSSKMMERMTDIVWSINPINDPLEKLLAKIKEFSSEILEPKDIIIHFYGEESLRNLSIDVESRKNLFLISKEALNNIAKYSEATIVEITLKRVASNLILIINDNGKGFASESVLPGNGLRNMKVRAQALRAELTLTSAENQGTRIEVIFPIT